MYRYSILKRILFFIFLISRISKSIARIESNIQNGDVFPIVMITELCNFVGCYTKLNFGSKDSNLKNIIIIINSFKKKQSRFFFQITN